MEGLKNEKSSPTRLSCSLLFTDWCGAGSGLLDFPPSPFRERARVRGYFDRPLDAERRRDLGFAVIVESLSSFAAKITGSNIIP